MESRAIYGQSYLPIHFTGVVENAWHELSVMYSFLVKLKHKATCTVLTIINY